MKKILLIFALLTMQLFSAEWAAKPTKDKFGDYDGGYAALLKMDGDENIMFVMVDPEGILGLGLKDKFPNDSKDGAKAIFKDSKGNELTRNILIFADQFLLLQLDKNDYLYKELKEGRPIKLLIQSYYGDILTTITPTGFSKVISKVIK